VCSYPNSNPDHHPNPDQALAVHGGGVDGGEALVKSSLPKVITLGYTELNLIYYFTAGEKEVRCWTLYNGSLAPQAAGVIHSDFERGFIKAEVCTTR